MTVEPLRWRTWTLQFYVPEGREAPSFEAIDAFLTPFPGVHRHAPYTGMFYTYENHATGVRGSFRYDLTTQVAATEDLAEALEEEPPPEVPGWSVVPLEFLASLGVATWYGWEAMPLIARACEGLGLAVLDHHRFLGEPRVAGGEELLDRWSEANRWVLARLADTPKERRLYLPPDRARAVWEYIVARPRLEADLASRGVRVPEVSFFAEGADAVTMVPWEAGAASIFPRVDRVAVKRVRTGWFGLGGSPEDGWVAWEAFAQALGPRLASRPGGEAWRVYDLPRMDRALRKAVLAMPLAPLSWRDRVDPGTIVDVRIPS
ncbi:MAG: hypothetical protein AAB434_03105 [Planctomycetota bacterium]